MPNQDFFQKSIGVCRKAVTAAETASFRQKSMEMNEVESDIGIEITPIASKSISSRAKSHTQAIHTLVVISEEFDDSDYEDSNKSDVNEGFSSENEQ